VFFSSSMVYGNFQTPEVAEDHPLEPIGIYGALKLGGEKLVIAYNQVFDMPYTIVRPSALYGPRCVSRRVGQAFIESAIVGDKLRVDGEGDEKLDFSYIDDVVNGVIASITHDGGRNQIFNMTAGKGRSLRDLVTLVQDHFPEIEVEYVERDALRPFRGTLSMEKVRDLLGFVPEVELEEGLTRYVAWYRELTDGSALTPAAS
jgi:nucleoside-diphosphate-sugar epimerase